MSVPADTLQEARSLRLPPLSAKQLWRNVLTFHDGRLIEVRRTLSPDRLPVIGSWALCTTHAQFDMFSLVSLPERVLLMMTCIKPGAESVAVSDIAL